MLTTLRIKNLGLVDDLTLNLGTGFITLTGETGAGKSMIIGALNLILGQRADRKLIRSGTDLCVVEAAFAIDQIRAPIDGFLEENGLEPCESDQLLLKRTVAASGQNRQFINHSPSSLTLLGQLGRWLVDIHGPYDHQSLFDNQKQLEVLDAFAGTTRERLEYNSVVQQIKKLQQAKAELIIDEQTYAQQLDLLRYQTHEIDTAHIDQIDESALEKDFEQAQNVAQIQELGQSLRAAIGESEPNLSEFIGQIGHGLHQLTQLDSRTQSLLETHIQLSDLADELQADLTRYLDSVDLDPSRLSELEDQINRLQGLKRKYGNTLEAIAEFGHTAQEKLQALESRDVEIEQIEIDTRSLLSTLLTRGQELTARRRKKGQKLGKETAKQLKDLGFEEGRFQVQIDSQPPLDTKPESIRQQGHDHIEFLFGPNPGEPLHPLKKIASSGEIARVMLALKTVLAEEDDVPLLVFDEVDANIGGETAHAVGDKMRHLGKSHQIICITHLAQVAAAATEHYQVSKSSTGSRTQTAIKKLTPKQRVDELGRLLGGKVSEAKKHAAALLRT